MQIGIDLIQISRIQKSLGESGDGLFNRICTPVERARLKGHPRLPQKLAGVFALKEAFAKALGLGIGSELGFQDIEVLESDLGKPLIRYVGRKIRFHGEQKMSASISHENDYLTAIVLVENEFHLGA